MTNMRKLNEVVKDLDNATKAEINEHYLDIMWKVSSEVENAISKATSQEEKIAIFDAFADEYKYLYAIDELHRELLNGGFEQYILNTNCLFVDMAIEGFEKIGLKKVADIVKGTMDYFMAKNFEPKTKVKKLEDMTTLFSEFKENVNLDEFTDKYYEMEDKIDEKIADYIFIKKTLLKSLFNDGLANNIIVKEGSDITKNKIPAILLNYRVWIWIAFLVLWLFLKIYRYIAH